MPNIKDKLFTTQTIDATLPTSTASSNTSKASSNIELVSLTDYSNTSVGVANKVLPSIVGITVKYNVSSIMARQQTEAEAQGSGIIISEDGYILTNDHIVNASSNSSYYQVSDANKIVVYLYNDETPYEATIVGTDELTDLAVIKIDKTGLTAAELGDSDNIKIGEFAMAIGNPLGMQSSVTCGIISATGRTIKSSDNKTYNVSQTDAAINSGNSGGALVNSKGEVIGINTLKLSGTGVEGMGFAIPINDTKDITEQLIKNKKVIRPYIGIIGLDLDENTAKYYNLVEGIYVKSVEDFSPAQKADIRNSDVIIKFNNTNVKTMNELTTEKNKCNVGDTVSITLIRDGKEKEVSLTLKEQP